MPFTGAVEAAAALAAGVVRVGVGLLVAEVVDVARGVEVPVAVGDWVGLGLRVTEGRGDEVEVVAHRVSVNTLVSSVTDPFRASARPWMAAPVFTSMEVSAMIVPTKLLPVPRVADSATCQKTWQLWASLRSTTLLLDAVVRPDPIWKMNTAAGSPSASSVRGPVIWVELGALYTPGLNSSPPNSAPMVAVGAWPAASS